MDTEKKKKNGKKEAVCCLVFLLVLYGMWAADALCPDRLYSDWEKRLLAQRPVLKAEDVFPAPTESFYRRKGKVHSQFEDVSAYLIKNGEIKLQFLIGNETALEGRQILRKASYQGGAYRAQLESGRPVYPVIGIVIDWTRKGERIPRSLHELLRREGVAEEDLELVDDVKLEVYHMNNLSPEIRARFTSDMGFVADYLNEGSFENRKGQKIVHIEALCEMMEALTGDTRFTDQVDELLRKQEEGKEITMCEYIDFLEARGEARGEERGITIGETRLGNLIQALLKEKKFSEIDAVSTNRKRRHELYKQYGI